jgi:hypothetical protein
MRKFLAEKIKRKKTKNISINIYCKNQKILVLSITLKELALVLFLSIK